MQLEHHRGEIERMRVQVRRQRREILQFQSARRLGPFIRSSARGTMGVDKEQLQKLVDKVGNSASAVRKELRRDPKARGDTGDLWSRGRALFFMTKPNCPTCRGTGWVCENHPDKPWDDEMGCTCGAGLPCECNTGEEPDIRQVIEKKPTRH
jgi:hypothetical protein